MKIASVQRPARGQEVCGDAFTILEGDVVTVALADGLGHGPPAHEAAAAFCGFIESSPEGDLESILRSGSEAIARTRGVAAVLARIDTAQGLLSFVGVGNVDLQAVSRKPIRPVSTPGIVGHRIRKVLQFDYELWAGDLLCLYTDGISSRYQLADVAHLDEQEMARTILETHGKNHDDATCIVIRY